MNGAPGAVQYLQFPSVGQRRIHIVATAADGATEDVTATVDVEGQPVTFTSLRGNSDIAIIGVTQSATQPYEAILTLGSLIDVRSAPSARPTGKTARGRRGASFDEVQLVKPSAATVARLFETIDKRPVEVRAQRLTKLAARRHLL